MRTTAPGYRPGTEEVRLSREMSGFSVTMIGVGAMIGAGIFVLTGIAAGVAGPGLLLAFGLNGIVTLFTAMAYAELGSCFHDAGGGYLWVKSSLPHPNGFLSGWMSWFAHAVACSLYALGFGAYFGHVLEGFGVHVPQIPYLSIEKTLAVVACLFFAYINFRGASETGKAGNFVTMAKILVILFFVAAGAWAMRGIPDWQGSFEPFLPNGIGAVFSAMGLTFIAFQGYEVIAQCSEEVVDPRRNIPRAIFFALLIVIPIYLMVAFVSIGAIRSGTTPSWTNFLAAVVLLVIDVAIALGIRLLVIKLLNSIDWERLAKRSPALRILEEGDIRYPFFEFIGAVVFWVVILVFTGTAARSLGLSSVELLIDHFVAFLPNLFLAFVILALGAWVGGLAGRFARAFARTAQVREANLIGKGVQYLVIFIALGTALEQLNVATRFLFGAFLIVLGALGLAFGLGGQEKAREIIRRISKVEKVEEGDPPPVGGKNRRAGDADKGEP